MKKISKILVVLFISFFVMTGCNSLLDVDSDREVFVDENQLKASNDTLYSMFAVLSELQKVVDSYVLLGELRGDLMDVSGTTDKYLAEINNFDISPNNPYAHKQREYYSVINNCNYVINTLDTTVTKGIEKVMLKEYAACKGIRAWAYMQLALNYGTVVYYDKPILSVEDAKKSYPEYTLEQLAPLLIEDLKPYVKIPYPSLGSLYNHYLANSFFPIRMLLGDLYLWTRQYDKAAAEYRNLMYENVYLVSTSGMRVTLSTVDGTTASAFNGNFYFNYSIGNDVMTFIAGTNENEINIRLDSLYLNRSVIPSDVSINNWMSQRYFYYKNASIELDTLVDMRKIFAVSLRKHDIYSNTSTQTQNYIYKYSLWNNEATNLKTDRKFAIYRTSLLYLRYAEAVNRLGKPNMAMAVLKYGLNRTNCNKAEIVPVSERTPLEPYMNFDDARFTSNVGLRMRTLGNADKDTTFVIKPLVANPTKEDSVLFMEDLIQKELALENAFEGNRFHDLMRFAIRRDDNAYLADKVALKHKTNREAIRTKLMDRTNWYLKK